MASALAIACCLAWSAPSGAQPSADPEALVARGAELYAAGKPLEAAALWEDALARLGQEAAWKINYNLGLAYETAGDATLAVERYEAFLRRVAAETATLSPEVEERREDAAARLARLRSAHGAILLPAQTAAIVVRIDGGAPRGVGFTAYLKPGEHRVEIVGKGAAARVERVVVAAGATQRVDTSDPTPPPAPAPAPVPPAPPAPEPPPKSEPRAFPTAIVLVGAGLTAASFALPIALWRVAAGKRDDADALGVGHTGYASAREDFESARTAQYASYALPAGLGAITLGVAIWGWIHVANDGAGASVEGRLLPAPEGASFDLRLRF